MKNGPDTYTDIEGNVYTRTDRGWVLTEYGPVRKEFLRRESELGAGRKRPDKPN